MTEGMGPAATREVAVDHDESPAWRASLKLLGVAAMLVLAVVAGRARAEHARPHVSGVVGTLILEVVDTAGIIVVVSALVVLVLVRRADLLKRRVGPGKKPKKGLTRSERRRVWIAACVGIAAGLAYDVLGLGQRQNEQQAATPDSTPKTVPGQNNFGTPQGPGGHAQGIGSQLTVVASVIALAVMLWVLMRRAGVAEEDDDIEDDEESTPAAVAAAAAAGRAAVRDRSITDPRQAIVACFTAMEHVLVGAGGSAVPRAADTPGEVLRRGLDHASLPAQPGRTLLRLFHEARFSDHPMTEDDRAAADRALEEIVDSVSTRLEDVR